LGVGKCNGDGFLDCAIRFPEIIFTKIVITINDFVKYLNDDLFINEIFTGYRYFKHTSTPLSGSWKHRFRTLKKDVSLVQTKFLFDFLF